MMQAQAAQFPLLLEIRDLKGDSTRDQALGIKREWEGAT